MHLLFCYFHWYDISLILIQMYFYVQFMFLDLFAFSFVLFFVLLTIFRVSQVACLFFLRFDSVLL